MPVAGKVIRQVGQIADGASRAAVERVVAERVVVVRAAGVRVRVAFTGTGRGADAGTVTSNPRLRRIATASCIPPWNSSEVARRPVANRWATPSAARAS